MHYNNYSRDLPLDFKKLGSDFSKKCALLLEAQQVAFCKVSYMMI